MIFFPIDLCTVETSQRLLDKAQATPPEGWWRERATVEWRISIGPEDFAGNPLVEEVLQRFVNPGRMYIQRLDKMTSYDWHRDYARDGTLNMGLNAFGKSYTLFGEKKDSHYTNLLPVMYQPNVLYGVDGSKLHCGMNLSDETRYLVSMSVTRPAKSFDVWYFVEALKQKKGC